jgi:hypothetical protein
MGLAMDLPTTVAGSAVLDSVGMAGLATASEVEDFTVAVAVTGEHNLTRKHRLKKEKVWRMMSCGVRQIRQ